MSTDMESLYQQRLTRYTTALRNGRPDMVPIRPFAAEFTAKYAGYTCQQVTHDFQQAYDAVMRCCVDFDWDATMPNMVWVWTGLVKAIGLNYYAIPGIHVPADTGFQYVEPEEDDAFMPPEDYDALIEDPTGYLYNSWLPRVADPVSPLGEATSFANNLSFVKGGMAMLTYFQSLGGQIARMRSETGTVSAVAGILKAPFDIIADKLRGYRGLCMDMFRCPDKVLAACEAMAPHLLNVAKTTADPDRNVPVGLWMHRGCVPFLAPEQFEKFYWPTLKWITEELHRDGIQTMYYAEGEWNPNLKYIAELPERSIVYHVDRGDIFEVHRALGEKFCISGGIPNDLLAFGSTDDVRNYCKKVIDGVARDGGYIMDASAIMQDEPKVENVQAMTQACRDFGQY